MPCQRRAGKRRPNRGFARASNPPLPEILAALLAVLRTLALRPLLVSRHRTLRHFLFEALYASGHTGLLLSRDGADIFVHDSRDRGPGRELFIRGTQDAGKVEAAIRLLREAGYPPIVRFADIGANIGTICIPAVSRGFAATAVALEAVPDIVRLLKANILPMVWRTGFRLCMPPPGSVGVRRFGSH